MPTVSFGRTQNDKYLISNSNGAITPLQIKISRRSLTGNDNDLFDGKYFYLVQFYELPNKSQRKEWANDGLHLTDYLSGNTYYAVVDSSYNLSTLSEEIRTILPVKTMFKEDPQLYNMERKKSLKSSSEILKLTISYYAEINSDLVIADLESLGAEIQNHRSYSRQIDITISSSFYSKIASLPYVQFIGLQYEEPVNETYNHRNSSGRTNYVNTGHNGLNYNGEGVVVSVAEWGTIDSLIDVKGRFYELVPGDVSNHKVTVTKNVGGAGTLDPSNKNNAWGATIYSAPAYPDYVSLYDSYHILFVNHSYGSTIVEGEYDLSARDHDLRIANYPLQMVVYSAGNSGEGSGLYAPYANLDQWANITLAAKHNKNHLSIGALNPNDTLMGFSSRGPTYDGRIIPQLAVEGIEGTSDAAPKVVGMLAVLEQIYKEKEGNEAPSTLLKAIMMNTADDLGNFGPDFKTGYGRPNIRRAYDVIASGQYITDSVDAGETNTHVISVPANVKQIRVMMVWPDVAAAVGATTALVNNLDIVGNDGTSDFYPWVLDATADASSLNLPATRGIDDVNTIEQITVDEPTTGDWTFSVSGTSVPEGPQTYYLVYEFISAELEVAFPLKDEHFESGENYYLRWDSYGIDDAFDISYEIDGSGTWNTIVTNYDNTKRVYEWTAPSYTDGIHSIRIKLESGSYSDTSDVNYIGSIPENFSIPLATGSSVQLFWNSVPGATGYNIYRLGDSYMDAVLSNITFNNDTSAVLTSQSTSKNEYYAVCAITNGKEGQRTAAIQKSAGDIIADPSDFATSSGGADQIVLSWNQNAASCNVLLAYSKASDFATPVNGISYSVGDTIDEDHETIVIALGEIESFTHNNLTENTQYYYKLWSLTDNITYSDGITTDELTDCDTTCSLPFEEHFIEGILPDCWRAKDHTGNGSWQFGTTSINSYIPNLIGNYAYINSNGVSEEFNTDLITPTLDLSGLEGITISFDHCFLRSAGGATASIFYSIDNGLTWTLLKMFSSTYNPSTYTSSIIENLANQNQVKIKWEYTSDGNDFYWAIDDITISSTNFSTVKTVPVLGLSGSTASSGGNVTSEGSSSVIAKGVCWSLNPNPTIDDLKTIDGTDGGAYRSDISGINPDSTYYLRAYATNNNGTSYGAQSMILPQPKSTDATSISSSGFTANWDAINSASGYVLDVSSTSFGNIALIENFDGFMQSGYANYSDSLDIFTIIPGWTGYAVTDNIGNALINSSSSGRIITPIINLSGNEGNYTLYFDLSPYYVGDDKKVIVSISNDGGSSFNPIDTLVMPESTTKEIIKITGGTENSQVKIAVPSQSSSNRFTIDNIRIEVSDILKDYNNLSVSSNSCDITVPESGTYYYRVRAEGYNSVTSYSNIISVTADNGIPTNNDEIADGTLDIWYNNGILYIDDDLNGINEVSVYNMKGCKILDKELKTATSHAIVIPNVCSGVYLVKVKSETFTKTHKVIILNKQ